MTDYTAGPAMQALNERQRKFVLAMHSEPFADHGDWARAAGYSDDRARVTACELLRHPKVRAASREIAEASMHVLGPPMAVAALLKLVANPAHRDHGKAVIALADRVGFVATQQVHVTHTDLAGEALLDRLRQLAGRLGLDAKKLIGASVIEREVREIKEGG